MPGSTEVPQGLLTLDRPVKVKKLTENLSLRLENRVHHDLSLVIVELSVLMNEVLEFVCDCLQAHLCCVPDISLHLLFEAAQFDESRLLDLAWVVLVAIHHGFGVKTDQSFVLLVDFVKLFFVKSRVEV